MKHIILLLSLLSTSAFGVDKVIKAPSGNLVLDAKTSSYVKSNKTFQTSTIDNATSGAGVNIVGRTSGSISSGYVGEDISGWGYVTNVSTEQTIATITLTPGVWSVSGSLAMDTSGASTTATIKLYVKGVCSGTFGDDIFSYPVNASSASPATFVPRKVTIVSGDANKTAHITYTSSGGTNTGLRAKIVAIRLP